MAPTPTIIWGNVKKNGTKLSGSGYDIVKSESVAGLYTILFDTPFTSPPGVSVTEIWPNDDPNSPGGNTKDNAVLVIVLPDRFKVKVGETDGKSEDRDFSFIAIGIQASSSAGHHAAHGAHAD